MKTIRRALSALDKHDEHAAELAGELAEARAAVEIAESPSALGKARDQIAFIEREMGRHNEQRAALLEAIRSVLARYHDKRAERCAKLAHELALERDYFARKVMILNSLDGEWPADAEAAEGMLLSLRDRAEAVARPKRFAGQFRWEPHGLRRLQEYAKTVRKWSEDRLLAEARKVVAAETKQPATEEVVA